MRDKRVEMFLSPQQLFHKLAIRDQLIWKIKILKDLINKINLFKIPS